MSRLVFWVALALGAPLIAAAAPAAVPGFKGPNFSGVYDCKGLDSQEGAYPAVVTLTLVPAQSSGQQGAYSFGMEVPGYGSYPGHAAADKNEMAIHFALTDPSSKDYGTGIARFKRNTAGKWTFRKFYFEPEFKGGNHGSETCVQR